MNKIRRFLKAAGDVLLPRTCIVCGCRLNMDEAHLCLKCLIDMPLTRFWERSHNPMADKFNERIQKRIQERDAGKAEDGRMEEETGGNGVEHERYAYAAALFVYHSEAGYRQIPYQIKYQGNIEIGKYFGRMLGRKLAEGRKTKDGETGDVEWEDADMVIPVPLHRTRLWKRGYNQAEIIAGAIADEMKIELRSDILVRNRRTRTQTKLEIEEKLKNVDGAFAVTDEATVIFRNGGQVRHILLVDDVFTTGSTLESCFNTLRKIIPPSVRISAVTLGYIER